MSASSIDFAYASKTPLISSAAFAELFAANATKLLDGKLIDNLVETNQFY